MSDLDMLWGGDNGWDSIVDMQMAYILYTNQAHMKKSVAHSIMQLNGQQKMLVEIS